MLVQMGFFLSMMKPICSIWNKEKPVPVLLGRFISVLLTQTILSMTHTLCWVFPVGNQLRLIHLCSSVWFCKHMSFALCTHVQLPFLDVLLGSHFVTTQDMGVIFPPIRVDCLWAMFHSWGLSVNALMLGSCNHLFHVKHVLREACITEYSVCSVKCVVCLCSFSVVLCCVETCEEWCICTLCCVPSICHCCV